MKALYQKVAGQAESLKGLWVAKLNLQGRSELATQQELNEYQTRREQVSLCVIHRCVTIRLEFLSCILACTGAGSSKDCWSKLLVCR